MKRRIEKDYFRRVRKILKSKLNGGNMVEAINCRAVTVVRYAAGIVEWTKEKLQIMDRKPRKLMTLHHALHPQADVDSLYFKRAEGGRGLMSVEDSVNSEMNSLSQYVESCNGPLLEAVYKEEVLRCYAKSYEAASLQRERKERFQEKQLHGQFWRNTAEIRDKRRGSG